MSLDHENPPLGTIVLTAAASSKFDESTGEILTNTGRTERFKLQDTASLILCSDEKDIKKKHRISTCCRVPSSEFVKVLKSQEHKKSFFGNLMTCKNIWACPVCASVVSERRADDVREACSIARSRGLKVTMLTLTTRHGINDDLSSLMEGITSAFRSFTSHRAFKRYRDAKCVVGFIKATEVTYSDNNGWHPHFHILVFSKSTLSVAHDYVDAYGRSRTINLAALWQKCCELSGLPIPDLKHGFALSDESMTLEDKIERYLTKFSTDSKLDVAEIASKISTWDESAELTKWHSKKGRSQSLTPFDFLRLHQSASTVSDNSSMAKYSHLFRDFVKSMYRRAQIIFSRGLRDLFDMSKELSDEELIQAEQDKADIFSVLVREEFKKITSLNIRADVLDYAEMSTVEEFARYIYSICNKKCSFEDYYRDFSDRIVNVKTIDAVPKAQEDLHHAISILSQYDNVTSEDYHEYRDEFFTKVSSAASSFSRSL